MSDSKKQPIISVIGAGYVGLTTATLLAEAGYTTFVLDINKERLAAIKSGRSFFYEEGIDPLIKHAVDSKKLLPTDSYEESIPSSDIVFSCVGTPDNPDGSSNLNFVFAAAEESAKYLKNSAVYIQKSTVPVGTGEKVEELFAKKKKKVSYVSNPEFLREGTAISDTLWFDRIVVGGNDKKAVEKVMELYRTIEKNRPTIARRAGVKAPTTEKGQYISTNRNSAELIKVTANAFLALKISFANSIAKMSDQTGADVNEVMDAVGADRRIGRAFLNAGRGYGGGCFPKDVSGLISSANEHGVEMPIMVSATDVNDGMPGYIANKAMQELGTLKDKKVAVLGLAFKAGTSDARKSPGIKLANILAKNKSKVFAYDPKANSEAKKEDLDSSVEVCQSIEEVLSGVDAVFLATDWPQFKEISPATYKKLMDGKLVVDAMNTLDKSSLIKAGLVYLGVGR